MNRLSTTVCLALLSVPALAAIAHAADAANAAANTAANTAALVPTDPTKWAMYGLAGAGLLYRKLRSARPVRQTPTGVADPLHASC